MEYLNETEIFKIGSTLHEHGVIDLLMHHKMVMATQNEVNFGELVGQIHIIILHHVGQCNNEVAFL